MNNKYSKIFTLVEKELSCSAHDMDHVARVYNLCEYLAKYEGNVDKEVLLLSALLHDIARAKEDNDTSRVIRHEILGSEMAEEILLNEGYSSEIADKVKHCITTHRFRSGNEPKSIEAKILFDADKLDAIGAVGIARAYVIAGEFSEKIYSSVVIDEYVKENVVENGNLIDISKHAPNLEYELKLKKIPERLYTKKAKEVAEGRIKFMELYFETIRMEIDGEK